MEAHKLATTSFKMAVLILVVKQIQCKNSDLLNSELPIKRYGSRPRVFPARSVLQSIVKVHICVDRG